MGPRPRGHRLQRARGRTRGQGRQDFFVWSRGILQPSGVFNYPTGPDRLFCQLRAALHPKHAMLWAPSDRDANEVQTQMNLSTQDSKPPALPPFRNRRTYVIMPGMVTARTRRLFAISKDSTSYQLLDAPCQFGHAGMHPTPCTGEPRRAPRVERTSTTPATSSHGAMAREVIIRQLIVGNARELELVGQNQLRTPRPDLTLPHLAYMLVKHQVNGLRPSLLSHCIGLTALCCAFARTDAQK